MQSLHCCKIRPRQRRARETRMAATNRKAAANRKCSIILPGVVVVVWRWYWYISTAAAVIVLALQPTTKAITRPLLFQLDGFPRTSRYIFCPTITRTTSVLQARMLPEPDKHNNNSPTSTTFGSTNNPSRQAGEAALHLVTMLGQRKKDSILQSEKYFGRRIGNRNSGESSIFSMADEESREFPFLNDKIGAVYRPTTSKQQQLFQEQKQEQEKQIWMALATLEKDSTYISNQTHWIGCSGQAIVFLSCSSFLSAYIYIKDIPVL